MGFVSKMAFKNARATFFLLRLGRAGNIFQSCSKNILAFSQGLLEGDMH